MGLLSKTLNDIELAEKVGVAKSMTLEERKQFLRKFQEVGEQHKEDLYEISRYALGSRMFFFRAGLNYSDPPNPEELIITTCVALYASQRLAI